MISGYKWLYNGSFRLWNGKKNAFQNQKKKQKLFQNRKWSQTKEKEDDQSKIDRKMGAQVSLDEPKNVYMESGDSSTAKEPGR